jgi:hypothetical protein
MLTSEFIEQQMTTSKPNANSAADAADTADRSSSISMDEDNLPDYDRSINEVSTTAKTNIK